MIQVRDNGYADRMSQEGNSARDGGRNIDGGGDVTNEEQSVDQPAGVEAGTSQAQGGSQASLNVSPVNCRADLKALILEFDPLENGGSSTATSPEINLLNDHTFQMSAMTPDELNTFLAVLPNISPPPLDMDAKNLEEELDRFEWDFEYRYKLLLSEALRNKVSKDQKAAAWMLAVGLPARSVLRKATWEANEDRDDIENIKKKLLDSVCTPATKRKAVNTFWDALQAPGESTRKFIARLELLCAQAKWEKSQVEENMISRLCRALRSKQLRMWIMAQDATVPLSVIKKHCIAAEDLDIEDQELQEMNGERDQPVYANEEEKKQPEQRRHEQPEQRRHDQLEQRRHGPSLCSYCGTTHHPGKHPVTKKFNCPASGHTCGYCGRRNHFESACWEKKKDQQAQSSSNKSPLKVKTRKIRKNEKDGEKNGLSQLIEFFQRGAEGHGRKNKKKSKKERTKAISESSDSSSDSEEERRKEKKAAKKKEKAVAANVHKRYSSDSTPSGEEPADFAAELSDSSEDRGFAQAVARSSFQQRFGRRDGGGSSRPGLCGGAPYQPPPMMKPATLLNDFRIPKIPKQNGKEKSVMEKKSLLKNKSEKKATEVRQAVSKLANQKRVATGVANLIEFSEAKNKKSRGGVSNAQPVSQATQVDATSEERSRKKKSWSENVVIDGKAIKMKVDSGSTVTILTMKDFLKLGISEDKLQPTGSRIVTYSGNRMIPIGKMKAKMMLRGRSVLAKILVIEEASTSLLGFPEGYELGLFRVDYGLLAKRMNECVNECLSGKDRSEHDTVPDETLELPPCKFTARIELKEGARPRILAPRRLPLALRNKTKEELDRMTRLGVISPVNEPREWCHQMVVADKPNGAVRVCLDPRLLNKFIRREEFQIPDFDALVSELTEAKVYTTIDLLSGFWQFELDEKSKELLTFATPFGRYQYNRLPFGLSCAPEMFHKRVVETLSGIPGVLVYIDDILIWGANQEEHDARVKLVQERLKEAHFSVNPKKCFFSQTRVKFLGHVVEDGKLSVDPSKVQAIRNLPSPVDRKGLKRILGMLSFVRKFIPDYNSLIYPFRPLLKDRTPFIWTATEEEALDKIRTSDGWLKALTLFKPGKPVTLMADASGYGLGAVLLQENLPVYFCSRTLTEAEERWAQIDKEFLALVWALERLDLFTYGQKVTVLTDHKPLLGLIDKPMDYCSIRQQRLLGRIMRYDIHLEFVPGKDMAIADTLSRAPEKNEESESVTRFMGTDLEANEVFVSECSTTGALISEFAYTENTDKTRQKICEAAEKCTEYQATRNAWFKGWEPSDAENCGEYWKVRDGIFESEGLLYHNGRVVIPRTLRAKFLRALHRGHPGINAMVSRARTIWWPGWEKEVKEFVRGCACCQKNAPRQIKEPMHSFEIPTAPGLVIASDHFFLGGNVYVLFTDTFSMWTEFFKVPSTSGKHLIRALRTFMARNGIPRVVTADQGAAFTSEEFFEFCEKMEIQLRVGSAKYSQGNAHAEAAVKRVKKWLKRCNNEDELFMAILAWHQTPLAQGRPSPAEIHLGRNVRDGLSWRVEQARVDWDDVRLWRLDRNEKAKKYYDRGSKPLSELITGQEILVWNHETKKWSEGVVLKQLERPRSYLIRTKEGAELERNRRDLKPYSAWHSFQDRDLIANLLQENFGRSEPPDPVGRSRIAAVRGRGQRAGGSTGGRAVEAESGGGTCGDGTGERAAQDRPERTPARTEQRRPDPGSPDGEPLHGSVGRDPPRVSPSPRRSPQVVRRRGRPTANRRGTEPKQRANNEVPETDGEERSRPRREKKLPVKYDDYVLY